MSEPTSSETDANSKPPTLADRLNSALKMSLENFVSNIKFSSFKKKYRAIYEADPDQLQSYFDQLKGQFFKKVRKDLDSCTKSHAMGNLLESLEKINENKNAISWRPSGNPEEDIRPHFYACKVQLRDKLKNYLSSLQVDKEAVITQAAVNHSQILQLKEKNTELCQRFSSIADLYAEGNYDNFEAKAAECFKVLKEERAKRKNTDSPKSAKKSRVL